MSEYTPTTDDVRAEYIDRNMFPFDRRMAREAFDRWLATHDAEVVAAERERIIADMENCSHPDDWNVPFVYVSSYAKRLRNETENEST